MRKKFLLLAGLCAFLLVVITFGVLLTGKLSPVFYPEASTLKEKSLAFLTDVVGFNLTKYNIVRSDYVPSTCLVSSKGLPIVSVSYNLQSSENKVQVCLDYAKENDTYTLESYNHIYLDSTAFIYPPYPTNNLLNWTKGFMERYQSFQNYPPYISEIRKTLDTVESLEPFNITNGNIKLQISIRQFDEEEIYTTLTFLYTSEGVDYTSKAVVFDFHNGLTADFADTWDQVKVGNEHIIVQQAEALEMAWQRAQVFVQNKYENESSKPQLRSIPELVYLSAEYTGTGTFNPEWHIRFSFSEPFYSAQDARTISYIEVGIWAYDKEVAYCYASNL
jgi:hypothetical protein